MTTVTPFVPSLLAPFQFQPTLDGQVYTVIVTWNLAGQRYYVNVYTLQGVLIASLPLIGSPLTYNADLMGGYFTDVMIYQEPTQAFIVNPPAPSVVYIRPVPPTPTGPMFINDGGVLQLTNGTGYPTSPVGLLPGAVWNNGLAVAIVPGVMPNPAAPPVYFIGLTEQYLFNLGGGNLPLTPPTIGSGQIWNNDGEAAVA